ncbi:MAG: phosphate/phosphite/phosphonate ABC transporter substrate-binding protein [Gammaproteobacteria bacterium]
MKKLLLLISVMAVSLLGLNFAQAAEVKVGVMASRGNLKAMKRWSEVGKYLSAETGTKIKIVPLKPNKTIEAVSAGKVDYMLANPVLTVAMQEKLGTSPLVTLKKKSGPHFAGVIIAKKGSGITKAEDLKGKKVMGYKFKRSAAAYVFQVKYLMDKGIDPHKDFAVFKEAKGQDDIVLAVKAGTYDAGMVKSGLLEAMAKEGKISMSDFVVIDPQKDGLTAVHTTKLYPQWYMSSTKKSNPELSNKIKSALLKLSSADAASKKAKIAGFVEPLSLDDLKVTLKALKLPPYN